MRDRTVAVAFTGHDLAWQSHRAVVLSVDASIDRDAREHSWLRLRSNGLTVAGFPLTDTRLSLDGLPQDHAFAFRVGAGKDAVMLRGRGAWVDERFTLSLDRIDASGPRVVPWRLEAPTRFSSSRDEAGLEPTCLVYESRRLCFEGQLAEGRSLVGESVDGRVSPRGIGHAGARQAELPRHPRRRRARFGPAGRTLDRRPARRNQGCRTHIQVHERRRPYRRARPHAIDARKRREAPSARHARERCRRHRFHGRPRGGSGSRTGRSANCRSAAP